MGELASVAILAAVLLLSQKPKRKPKRMAKVFIMPKRSISEGN
jgi:hypothetical protein